MQGYVVLAATLACSVWTHLIGGLPRVSGSYLIQPLPYLVAMTLQIERAIQ